MIFIGVRFVVVLGYEPAKIVTAVVQGQPREVVAKHNLPKDGDYNLLRARQRLEGRVVQKRTVVSRDHGT